MKPRLLFISPRFLFPMDQGGKIRTGNILRGLKGGAFDITLASPIPPDPARFNAELTRLCDRFVSWPEPKTSLVGKILALAGSLPVPVATDRSSAGTAIITAELAKAPDVVVVDFPHAHILLPNTHPTPPLVMFTHNVEAEIFARHADVAHGPMKWIWHAQARKMRRFEGNTLRTYNAVIAVSTRDAQALERDYNLTKPASVIDTGVDLDFYPYTHPNPAPPGGGRIVFSGAMDSRSNIDGVEWMAETVWPHIIAARPQAELIVVGRNPPPALVAKTPFTFTGYVDDIRPHIVAADVSVIPLRVGSGTRIKAFEAMAMGRPVVSTRIGTEGLDITPNTHFLEQNTPETFAQAVLHLLDNPQTAQTMAQAARTRLEERFSWHHVARQFEAICQST